MTKPLHVQVAEALGWTNISPSKWPRIDGLERFDGDPPSDPISVGYPERVLSPDERCRVPRFDQWWSTTGPLIEKYRITIRPTVQTTHGMEDWPEEDRQVHMASWSALIRPTNDRSLADVDVHTLGTTPLIAACNLILQLHKVGKLSPM